MEDWAAVAKAINERVEQLGWPQGELAARSRLSRGTVHEIQHRTAERRRSARTLEALSVALGWDRDHLDAVANGRPVPSVDDHEPSNAELRSRIDGLEQQIAELSGRIEGMQSDLRTVADFVRRER